MSEKINYIERLKEQEYKNELKLFNQRRISDCEEDSAFLMTGLDYLNFLKNNEENYKPGDRGFVIMGDFVLKSPFSEIEESLKTKLEKLKEELETRTTNQ